MTWYLNLANQGYKYLLILTAKDNSTTTLSRNSLIFILKHEKY